MNRMSTGTSGRTGRSGAHHPVFHAFDDHERWTRAIDEFTASAAPASVPVFVGGRPDLARSIDLAADLYRGVAWPEPAELGVLLGELPAPVAALTGPLARRWSTAEEFAVNRSRWSRGSLLVVGVYEQLRLDSIRDLLLETYRRQDRLLSLISGRDAASVAWNAAKQYAVEDPLVTGNALFTDTDRPPSTERVRVFDDRSFDEHDIQGEILGSAWRRISFQGHGKDDSINLGEFTICGLNESAPRNPDELGPRCAYGHGCYKPEDKLVPLNEVRALEVVLSACNSGPLADLALYDPRFQLLLNALDGPARTVAAAVSVHDSDRPENTAWEKAVRAGADSVLTLNASLAGSHPYPAFLRFGLPTGGEVEAVDEPIAEHEPDQLVRTAGERLTGMLAGGLLSHNHPLRPRLTKLARKVDLWTARPTHQAGQAAADIRSSLTADLQSLDHTIARQVIGDPETELMNYPAYFGDRSRLDPRTGTVECHCGRPAQSFTKRGLLPYVLDTTCVVCMRCGDVTFRLPDSPVLWAYAADSAVPGGTLEVTASLRAGRRGPVQLGLFVPTYLRDDVVVEPAGAKVTGSADQGRDVRFSVRFAESTAPQAYYFTVFAVQDLAISTARRHFGIIPGS